DPHRAYDGLSVSGLRLLNDSLVDYAPDSAEIVPSLATHWEISPDGREYTFYLRHGVRFHNGREFTADDIRRSFERMLDSRRVVCPVANMYHLLDGYEDYHAHRAPHIAGLTVIDPWTVRFRLDHPDQTFLNLLAMPFAAPIATEVAD